MNISTNRELIFLLKIFVSMASLRNTRLCIENLTQPELGTTGHYVDKLTTTLYSY
jgi:hypothetical protein